MGFVGWCLNLSLFNCLMNVAKSKLLYILLHIIFQAHKYKVWRKACPAALVSPTGRFADHWTKHCQSPSLELRVIPRW
jgi:hypothetical protein